MSEAANANQAVVDQVRHVRAGFCLGQEKVEGRSACGN